MVGRGLVLKRGGRVALTESDFAAPAGAVTSLIGPNGSGKTTLLHAVAGLVEPAGGSIEVFGGPPARSRDRIAYVLQSTAVNDTVPVTVAEVVAMGRYPRRGWFRRLRRDDRTAAEEALDRLAIADLRHRHLRELSGGQRQRVFVAQALAQDADLLLLDEPVTALDLVSHEAIDAVVEEEAERGRTVILTTHDVSEAQRADHVLLLGGRVVAEGAADDVLTEEMLVTAYGAQLLHVHSSLPVDDPHHSHFAPPRPGSHRTP